MPCARGIKWLTCGWRASLRLTIVHRIPLPQTVQPICHISSKDFPLCGLAPVQGNFKDMDGLLPPLLSTTWTLMDNLMIHSFVLFSSSFLFGVMRLFRYLMMAFPSQPDFING